MDAPWPTYEPGQGTSTPITPDPVRIANNPTSQRGGAQSASSDWLASAFRSVDNDARPSQGRHTGAGAVNPFDVGNVSVIEATGVHSSQNPFNSLFDRSDQRSGSSMGGSMGGTSSSSSVGDFTFARDLSGGRNPTRRTTSCILMFSHVEDGTLFVSCESDADPRIVIVRELIAEFTPEVQFVRLIPAVTPRMFRQDFLVGEERSRPITPIEVVLDHYETHRQNYEEERRREQADYERRCEEFRAAYREEALRAQRAAGRRASSEASALGSAEVASGASASVVEDLLFSDLRVGSVPSTSSFGPPASIDCASPADASRQFPRPRDIEALLPSAPPALACNKGRDWLRAALRLSEGPAYERRHPSPGGDVHAIAHEDKPVCEALWTALESRCGHGTEVSATMALYSEEHGRNPFGLLDELDKIVTKVSSAGCWKALQTFVTYRMASRSTAAQHVERVYADAEAIEKGGVTLPPRLINFVAIQSLDSRYEGLKQKCEHDPDYAEKVSDKSRFALLRLLSDQNVPSDYPRGGSGRSRSRSPAPSAASAALSVGVESLSTADLTKLIKRCKGNKNFTQALWGAGCVEHATQAAQQLAKMKRDKGKEKENRRRRDPRRGDEDAAGTADDGASASADSLPPSPPQQSPPLPQRDQDEPVAEVDDQDLTAIRAAASHLEYDSSSDDDGSLVMDAFEVGVDDSTGSTLNSNAHLASYSSRFDPYCSASSASLAYDSWKADLADVFRSGCDPRDDLGDLLRECDSERRAELQEAVSDSPSGSTAEFVACDVDRAALAPATFWESATYRRVDSRRAVRPVSLGTVAPSTASTNQFGILSADDETHGASDDWVVGSGSALTVPYVGAVHISACSASSESSQSDPSPSPRHPTYTSSPRPRPRPLQHPRRDALFYSRSDFQSFRDDPSIKEAYVQSGFTFGLRRVGVTSSRAYRRARIQEATAQVQSASAAASPRAFASATDQLPVDGTTSPTCRRRSRAADPGA
ncbi:hypothetical protein THAOC_13999 [Thalassiosira oceanica]|uniref:Uncharacterized protein n=1 Tax=Thalassiosira oceanica TaxID=159749 RepID=K0SW49_THAOC|nr:hypothetical protein THAOC_13999 [Thalassiosira oceanica]|eukprot:EJK65176.1 hypothetical protein THAOC_13999 [Thalassiosira oceanica]